MKGVKILIPVGIAAFLSVPAFGQEGAREIDRVEDSGARGRFWQYEVLRDQRRERQEMEAEAQREQQLEQSKAVQESLACPTHSIQSPITARLRDRLDLVNKRIQLFQKEKGLAVQQGKTPEELAAIDVKIEGLRRQASALETELSSPLEPVATPVDQPGDAS